MRISVCIAFAVVLLVGCKEDYTSTDEQLANELSSGTTSDGTSIQHDVAPQSSLTKKLGAISFRTHAVQALDYLKRSGEHVAVEDVEDLKEESAFMLEFTSENMHKSIFDSKGLKLTKDKAIQYMIADIQEDYTVIQNEKKFTPNGVHFEGQIGTQNTIRVTFYMKGIDVNQPFQVEYYDRMFGKGMIKFKKTENEIIS